MAVHSRLPFGDRIVAGVQTQRMTVRHPHPASLRPNARKPDHTFGSALAKIVG